ncbi:GNAT family N-acetyltransferase [Limnohabitans sp. JUR4]|uniref:GNAT family N-acetyltransferase n=2 Tax=Limnohabitans radicicola TaxID=2771427 RepID=A0A927IN24_9BURK|nr:GNAT family N-acetyltransferase [Limnohabitans radicicola]
MMAGPFSVVPLDLDTDRSGFECGVEPLDRYFKTQVSQDIKRRVTACFTALDASGRVAGYYTLASASILLTDLSESLAKKLPRYPNVPAVRMGRLAVDQDFKGKGLGAALLADALRRAVMAEIAAYAFVVDAKDESAAEFYAHHGFRATADNPLFLYLPLATVKDLVKPS